ncbi:MAG: GntR family transcriptional regulator [Elusimicrobiales bacterium]|nr:GntR family transcriptional regulator [Elusimicrobiales bacterium]
MITLNQFSQVPIYDQIKLGLKGLVKKGLLRPGDAAPSIRKMAADLKVNPNTVARAFRELTAEGFFESLRGQENIISPRAGTLAAHAAREVSENLEAALKGALESGFSWSEIDKMISVLKRKLL